MLFKLMILTKLFFLAFLHWHHHCLGHRCHCHHYHSTAGFAVVNNQTLFLFEV